MESVRGRYGWCEYNGDDSGMLASYAAAWGHLHALQLLADDGRRLDERVALQAARNGHANVLRWALEKGCPVWPTCVGAAMGAGQLVTAQVAKTFGCPWEDSEMPAEGQGPSALLAAKRPPQGAAVGAGRGLPF